MSGRLDELAREDLMALAARHCARALAAPTAPGFRREIRQARIIYDLLIEEDLPRG